jgi:hypothetical protein
VVGVGALLNLEVADDRALDEMGKWYVWCSLFDLEVVVTFASATSVWWDFRFRRCRKLQRPDMFILSVLSHHNMN